MPRPNKNKLNPTKSLVDYASQDRILKAYDNNMKAIREDASRYRNIIRKRLDRMEAAGETTNPYYNYYKDRETKLGTVRGMSDEEVMRILPTWAAGVSGAYQDTLTAVKQARADLVESWRLYAEEEGDEDLADLLSNPTPEQMAAIGKLMGMITYAVGVKGKLLDSATVYQEAMKAVLGNKKGSLLTKAANIINNMGLDDSEDASGLSKMKEKYSWQGGVKVSYQKSHKKRGK